MRSRCALLIVFLAGCSTHPVYDICDYFKPGHLYPDKVAPYGGVCIPQGVGIQGMPPSVPPPPMTPAIPPAVPIAPPGTPGNPAVTVPTFPTAPPAPY